MTADIVEQHAWTGTVRVIVRDAATGRFRPGTRTFRNLIVNAGKNLARDVLTGFVSDAKIKYVALGTSGTAPAATDTQLGAEVFRKAVTSYDNSSGGTGAGKTTLYLAPGDAVGVVIAELGWFAGASASGTANSGTLVAHTLYAHTKLSTESINIVRTDQF